MTLALYGKSRRRQGALLAAPLFAVLIATIGALGAISSGGATSGDATPGGATLGGGNHQGGGNSPTLNIQVHKYLPKENPPANAPWQNQGNGQGQWTFSVYTSLADAQAGTNAIATFSQVGSNSPDLPQADLWIKETGMPSGYQFFAWFVPDGDDNSGNDKCNTKPLDGTGLDTNPILHIPASYWSTKGNNTGLFHICAYNKPKQQTIQKSVTFSKYICDTFKDVPANQKGGDGPDDTGKPVYPAGGQSGLLVTVSPPGDSDPTVPRNPEPCKLATTPWTFNLWTGDRSNGVGGTLLQTVTVTGSAPVPLADDVIKRLLNKEWIYVEEVYQPGYAFGALKCFTDHLGYDNWEWLWPEILKAQDPVHCIAYNVDLRPRVTKKPLHTEPVGDPEKVEWTVEVTAPGGGLKYEHYVWIKDQDVTVTSGPAYTGEAGCKPDSGQTFEQALNSPNGVVCKLPAGSSITFTVKPAKTPEPACKDQTFTNTVTLYLDDNGKPGSTTIATASSTITLKGDDKLCTRTIRVCKVVEDNGDGYTRPAGTFILTVNDGSQTTQHALDAAEGGQPACSKDMTVPANATITVGETATRPLNWNGDADGYPKVTGPDNSGTYTVTNREKPITVTVNFVKKICETFKDVPKNPGTSYVHVGAPVVQETVAALGDTDEGKCETATSWNFEIWSSTTTNGPWPANSPTGGTLLQTVGVGPNVLNSAALTELLNSPSKRLFVKENYQDGYMFAALKCEGDTLNNDNWEWIFWSAAQDGQVTCIAYNVPATKTITLVKWWIGDSSITQEDYPTFQGLPEGATCTGPVIAPAYMGFTGTWTCTVPYSWNGTVTETPAAGWQQCQIYAQAAGNGIGEVAATFTNCKRPSIVVKKVVTNVTNDTTQFTVTLTDGSGSQTGQIAEWNGSGPVNATFGNLSLYTNYTVTESSQNGYQVLGWAARSNDSTCPDQHEQTGAVAELGYYAPGDTVIVCFYNERFGNVVVDKQAPTGAVTPGTTFNWTIAVSVANGPTSSALTLTDTLPSGFTYGTPTVSPATAPTLSCTLTGLSLSCTLPANTPVGTYTVTIPTTVPTNDFGVCGPKTNTVSFSGAGTQGTDIATVNIGCVASDGRILVRKVVKGQPGDTTSFTAELTGPGISGTATQPFSQQNIGLFLGLSAGTFTVSEQPKDGYAYLGWAYGIISGDSVTCPANPTGTGSATATLSNVSPQAAICFYNEARVTIRVHKKLNVVGFTSNGAGWQFTLTGCGITPQTATTGPNGIAEFSNLPPAIGCVYTVTETVQSGWTPQFVSQTAQPVAGGQVVTLEFLNIQNFNPPCVDPNDPRCVQPPPPSTPTPTPTTPTTPTNTPTPTPTNTPTPTPTNTPTPTPTKTPVTQVAGERTPGPGTGVVGVATPLAPSTGYGFGSAQGGMSLLLVLAGLVSLSLGLAFLVVGRRTNR